MSRFGVGLCLAMLAFLSLPLAAQSPTEPWLAWGGEASVSFNPDALRAIGVSIAEAKLAIERTPGVAGVRYDLTRFAASDGATLEILHTGSRIVGVGGGRLAFPGGFVFARDDATIDLRGFSLGASADTRFGIGVADANGVVWFTADHAHIGVDDGDAPMLSMRHMNLRLSRHFADVLHRPDLAGYPVGGLAFRAHVAKDAGIESPGDPPCTSPWPGAGQMTDIRMIYEPNGVGANGFADTVIARRCALPPVSAGNVCTAGSTNGEVVITPDSSLRNIGTSGVAWYGKFTGNFPPYGNDQHPYLIWNLYRIDAAGRIKQIGASGVKHAFYTVNWNCTCAAGNVIHPMCEDTYSFSSNDNSPDGGVQQYQALAPRSEIIPASGLWGRCGSIFDQNCDGVMDAGSGAADLYEYRLLATESDMLAPLSTGAQYFLEYWYVVRDDQNIDDSLAYRQIWPRKNGATWSIGLTASGGGVDDGNFFQGPAIDRWVNPAAPPANAASRTLSTPLGRARVAVKATNLGAGQWRYEYAVMNLDYAHAAVDPAHPSPPNLRVVSNHGFRRFEVAFAAGTAVSNIHFSDADDDSANDWTASTAGNRIAWTAPAGNTLDWGTLYHFEFTASAAPSVGGAVTVTGAATSGEPEIPYTLVILGPRSDTIFANGFES